MRIEGGSAHHAEDFELNIASIIDCFTVLIAFMLASASFLSIGILDAGLAASGDTASSSPPPVQISVELKNDKSFAITVSGKQNLKRSIASEGGSYNYGKLSDELQALKTQWKDVQGATLTAENTTEYQEIMRGMDATRKSFPAVLLGGF